MVIDGILMVIFHGIYGGLMESNGIYPLVNVYILRNGKIHQIFNGKIHYFDWAIFHGKLLVHQRVRPCCLQFKKILFKVCVSEK